MSTISKQTAELLLKSSESLAQSIPVIAFEFWQRKDFRILVDFFRLSRTEQDRMFNELEVSIIGLFDLYLAYINSIAPPEYKKMVEIVQKELIGSFLAFMSKNGVEKKYIEIWEKLIEIRLKEYWQHYKISLKEAAAWKEFKDDNVLRVNWARIETITIDCITHIRRGKVKKGDPLWKLLRKWFIDFNAKLLPLEKLVI